MMASPSPQTEPEILLLPDSRKLAYNIYGSPLSSSNPSPPIFYFHGYPASPLEAAIWSSTASKLNLTYISPDRPGMGFSTFQPNRTLLDWAADVVALADHLNIKTFYLLGVSGGGPYVLASLKTIPAERISGAAIVSGLYPLKLGAAGMLWGSWMLLKAASWAPGIVEPLLEFGIGKAARAEDGKSFEALIMQDMVSRPEVDRKCMDDLDLRGMFLDSVRESPREGTKGMAWEAKLFGCPWGFELDELDVEGRLMMWHGGVDRNSPVGMAVEASNHIAGADLTVSDEDGHVSLIVNRMEEILRSMVHIQ